MNTFGLTILHSFVEKTWQDILFESIVHQIHHNESLGH